MEDQQISAKVHIIYAITDFPSMVDKWFIIWLMTSYLHVLLVLCGPIGTNCNLTQ